MLGVEAMRGNLPEALHFAAAFRAQLEAPELSSAQVDAVVEARASTMALIGQHMDGDMLAAFAASLRRPICIVTESDGFRCIDPADGGHVLDYAGPPLWIACLAETADACGHYWGLDLDPAQHGPTRPGPWVGRFVGAPSVLPALGARNGAADDIAPTGDDRRPKQLDDAEALVSNGGESDDEWDGGELDGGESDGDNSDSSESDSDGTRVMGGVDEHVDKMLDVVFGFATFEQRLDTACQRDQRKMASLGISHGLADASNVDLTQPLLARARQNYASYMDRDALKVRLLDWLEGRKPPLAPSDDIVESSLIPPLHQRAANFIQRARALYPSPDLRDQLLLDNGNGAPLPFPLHAPDNVQAVPAMYNMAKMGDLDEVVQLQLLAMYLAQSGISTGQIATLLNSLAELNSASVNRRTVVDEQKQWCDDVADFRRFLDGDAHAWNWRVSLPEPDIEVLIRGYDEPRDSSPQNIEAVAAAIREAQACVGEIEALWRG